MCSHSVLATVSDVAPGPFSSTCINGESASTSCVEMPLVMLGELASHEETSLATEVMLEEESASHEEMSVKPVIDLHCSGDVNTQT